MKTIREIVATEYARKVEDELGSITGDCVLELAMNGYTKAEIVYQLFAVIKLSGFTPERLARIQSGQVDD